MLETINQLDTQLFLHLNGLHTSFLDPIMVFVSKKLVWIPLYALVLFFIFYKDNWQGVPALTKRSFWKLERTSVYKSLAVMVFAILVVVLCDRISVECFKNVFERLRPGHNPEIKDMVRHITGRGGKYGFVSSHAANTFGFAMFSALFFSNKIFSYFIFFWAAFISYSRIYLGKHFPGDVIGGALLGMLIGWIVYLICMWFYTKYITNTKPKPEALV